MKSKAKHIGMAALALLAVSSQAMAQIPGVESSPKSLGHALLNSVIFATVGMIMVAIGIKIFDKATPGIVLEKELLANNIAVAIVTAAVIIGISIIIAASMS